MVGLRAPVCQRIGCDAPNPRWTEHDQHEWDEWQAYLRHYHPNQAEPAEQRTIGADGRHADTLNK